MTRGPLYLSASDVEAAMPPVAERIELAERTMLALRASMPTCRPRSVSTLGPPARSPMPCRPRCRPRDGDPALDLLGIKWVTGFPGNRALGLPAIAAIVVLSDPTTGRPVAILDGGPITAQRTAAVSGVALHHFGRGPGAETSSAPVVALIGAGVQGASHLAVIGHVLPGASLRIHDRHPDRASALAERARATPGISAAEVARRRACSDLGGRHRHHLRLVHRPGRPPGDDRRLAAAGCPGRARRLRHDVRRARSPATPPCSWSTTAGQFLANRDAGQFDGYPDPGATFGEAIFAGTAAPAAGRVVATHLGVGLADVVFAAAIVAEARTMGLGTTLPG